jgi:hypothetical protein
MNTRTRICRDDWLVWELFEDPELTPDLYIIGQREDNYNGDVKWNGEDTFVAYSRCNLFKLEELRTNSTKLIFNRKYLAETRTQ